MSYSVKFAKGGNLKMNAWTFSKVAGNTVITTKSGVSCVGTCSKYCHGCWTLAVESGKRPPCYVAKSYRYDSVKKGHIRNTNGIRNDLHKAFTDLVQQIARARKKPLYIRIHAAGELETVEEFLMWSRIADIFPNISFWVYTKAFDLVTLPLLAGLVPDNLTVLFSIWHEYGIEEYKKIAHLSNVKAFVYLDDFDYSVFGLEITTLCQAYDSKGKINHNIKCDKCKKCFNRLASCKVVGCYDHK